MESQKENVSAFDDYLHVEEDLDDYSETESEDDSYIKRAIRDTTLSFAIAYGGY